MKVLLFDPFAGASGDMTIGCLLDLGADPVVVREAIESLGCKLEISKEQKSHILATRARVTSDKRYHSLEEAKSLLQNARLEPPARDRALKVIDTRHCGKHSPRRAQGGGEVPRDRRAGCASGRSRELRSPVQPRG